MNLIYKCGSTIENVQYEKLGCTFRPGFSEFFYDENV